MYNVDSQGSKVGSLPAGTARHFPLKLQQCHDALTACQQQKHQVIIARQLSRNPAS